MADQEIHTFSVPVTVPEGELRAAVLTVDTSGIEFAMTLLSVECDVGQIATHAKNSGLPCIPGGLGTQMNPGDVLTAIIHNPDVVSADVTVTWTMQENSGAQTPL